LVSSASLAGIQVHKLGGCVHVIVCGRGGIGILCDEAKQPPGHALTSVPVTSSAHVI